MEVSSKTTNVAEMSQHLNKNGLLVLLYTSANHFLPTLQRKQPVMVPSSRRSLWTWSTPRTHLMGGSP